MQPLTATANPPEDIEAVLGRFHAWSATRTDAGKKIRKLKDLPEGVRELSYEDALESSRSRWQARVQRSEHEEATSKPPVATTQASFDQAVADVPILPDKLSLSTAAAPTQTRNPHEGQALAFSTALLEALPAEPDSSALALIWPAPPKNERQVSMSLRVATSEQALIKARAAEAGLSVSAYLRQCALEVEKLRAQVQHTLALIEERSERPVRSLTAGSSQPTAATAGFFTRLRHRVFGTPTRLTLRA